MYANETKIDRLLRIADRNSADLLRLRAQLTRIEQKVDGVWERLRVADLRNWAASRAALGLWTPRWDEAFTKQFNFDAFEKIGPDGELPPRPKKTGAIPIKNIPRHIAAAFSSRLAHPFSITCGSGWEELISRALA